MSCAICTVKFDGCVMSCEACGMGSEEIGPTIRRHALGTALRRRREELKLTRPQVAERIEYSVASLARVESGRTGLKVLVLRTLMDLYEITDPAAREELETLAREGRMRSWWSDQRAVLRPSYGQYIGMEDEAEAISYYAAKTIPGLLQTEPYARAIAASAIPPTSASVVDDRVGVRMKRQHILARADPPQLHVILDEGALRRRVGGHRVWLDQLYHLIECTRRHHVSVQVIPFELGADPSVLAGFVTLRVPGLSPIVYIELDSTDSLLEGEDADPYTLRYEHLRTLALPPPLSLELIHEVADQGKR